MDLWMNWCIDRKTRLPRIWSNKELKKFASYFKGHVVNVSAWKDEDKQGCRYRDYFSSATNYSLTNYLPEARGLQEGLDDQIFLNLEGDLPVDLKNKFDVVFNHSVLSHVFECVKAFDNLCAMSSDIVIVVIPFLQHQQSAYGDYWRFTPEVVNKLFKKNNMELLYINYNDGSNQFIYIFAIASKNPDKWQMIKNHPDNHKDNLTDKVGYAVIRQRLLFHIMVFAGRIFKKIKSLLRF